MYSFECYLSVILWALVEPLFLPSWYLRLNVAIVDLHSEGICLRAIV